MDRHIFVIFINFVCVFSSSASDVLLDKYLGCFRNFTNQTLMPMTSFVDQSMTIDYCINICRNNFSTFAGLQEGNQCLCGEDFNELVAENSCTEECSGNSSQYCGGATGQSISIYSVCSIGYFGVGCERVCHCDLQAPCQRLTGSCPTGCDNNWTGQACGTANASPMNPEWYVGCYDDIYNTAMEVNNPGGNNGRQTNSINNCISVCARFNYTYCGTQFSIDCNCGESYSRYGPSGGCSGSYPCRGNTSQICGGYSANSVYSVCPIGSFSLNCLSSCNCLNNTRCIYRNGTCPAGCKPGWTGNSCSIRDCSVADGNCDGPNEFCETVDLKYATKTRCGCNKGYTRSKSWNNCTDIDECLDIVSACGADAYSCANTDGSFICGYCPVGFVFRNDTCIQLPNEKEPKDSSANSNVGIIVGAVLGCFFALVIGVIVGILLYRCIQHRASSDEKRVANADNNTQIHSMHTGHQNVDSRAENQMKTESAESCYAGLDRSVDNDADVKAHVYQTINALDSEGGIGREMEQETV